jgi:apolipoprotein N-acyltransferase
MGLGFGVAFWGSSLIWVLTQVAPTFSWAYPGFGLLMVLLGGLSALFSWGYLQLRRGAGVPVALALPLAWVGVEWIKAHFPLGLAFPWLGLGVSLTGQPELLGLAEWTGEAGVSFWLAGVNGLVVVAIQGGREGRIRGWLLALMAAMLPSVLGIARAETLELGEGPRVAVVGTEVPRSLRGEPEAYAREALEQVRFALDDKRRASLPTGGSGDEPGPASLTSADLVLLPEATLPLPFESDEARPYRDGLEELARELGAPVLVGTQGSWEEAAGGGAGVTNAILLLSAEGRAVDRYDKTRLVPAMEGGYARGEGMRTLEAEGVRAGPLLCYESLFGVLARKAAARGADLLVNLSSDVWFGRGASGIKSLFLHQHPAHLVLRAVETRLPVARAANGGFSLVLDPLGRPVGPSLPPGEGAGVLVTVLPKASGTTLFTRTGDLVGRGALLLSLLLVALSRRRRPAGDSLVVPDGPA